MDPLLSTLLRWFEIIERQAIDPETFSTFEVWLHAQQVLVLADQGQDLPPAAVNVLAEIWERLTLSVGAAPPAIATALEEHLGPCPDGDEALAKFAQYLQAQLNAFEKTAPKKGPSLSGEEKPVSEPHPHWPEKKLW